MYSVRGQIKGSVLEWAKKGNRIMGRSSLQGTPWHYEEEPPKDRYERLNGYWRRRKKAKEEKMKALWGKSPAPIPVLKPGCYVRLEEEDGDGYYYEMAHVDYLVGLKVGDKLIFNGVQCIVVGVEMPRY